MALPDKSTILRTYSSRGLPFSNVLANASTGELAFRGLPFFATSGGGGGGPPPDPPATVYQPQMVICM